MVGGGEGRDGKGEGRGDLFDHKAASVSAFSWCLLSSPGLSYSKLEMGAHGINNLALRRKNCNKEVFCVLFIPSAFL